MYHWAVQLFRTSTLSWRRRVSSSTSERQSVFWLSFWWQTTDSYNNLKSGLDQFGCPCHHIVVLVIVAAILMSERRYMWVLKKILHMFLPLSAYLLRHRDHLAIRPSEIRVNVIGRWAVLFIPGPILMRTSGTDSYYNEGRGGGAAIAVHSLCVYLLRRFT